MRIENKRLQMWMHVHGFTEETLPTSDKSDNPIITIDGERAHWTWHFSCWITKQIRDFAQEDYAPLKSYYETMMTFYDKGGHESFDKWLAKKTNFTVDTSKAD